jgi:hypothetical protein
MLGVPRVLFSMAFLGLGLYLVPGLFALKDGERQRPNGAVYSWIHSFIRQEPDVHWKGHLATALKEAEDQRKYIFIDFTGLV